MPDSCRKTKTSDRYRYVFEYQANNGLVRSVVTLAPGLYHQLATWQELFRHLTPHTRYSQPNTKQVDRTAYSDLRCEANAVISALTQRAGEHHAPCHDDRCSKK